MVTKRKKKKAAASTGKGAAAATTKAKAKPKPRSKVAATGGSEATRIAALTKVFAALGAADAERWATAQVKDGTDELSRFVLLRALWFRTVEPGRLLAAARKDASVRAPVERLMGTASLADLDALVRFAQKTALADVCRVLDDPADHEDGIRWGVFRLDAEGAPVWAIDRLRAGLEPAEPR